MGSAVSDAGAGYGVRGKEDGVGWDSWCVVMERAVGFVLIRGRGRSGERGGRFGRPEYSFPGCWV